MEIIRPGQVSHLDDKGRPQALFSVSISRPEQGQRLVLTSALNSSISIWEYPSFTPVATGLARHEGAVLTVRWCPHQPQVFASGSDDRRVLIWQKHGDEYRVIGRPAPVHTCDVTAVEWSPDGRFLASGSLDKTVCIYDVSGASLTAPKLHQRIELQGFVKGLCFDQNSRCLAIQTDDKSAHLYECDGDVFALKASIRDCFVNSSDNAFFSRPSFSPDSNIVALSNGSNGPIPCAHLHVVDAQADDGGVSLIGHQAPIEVATFSPFKYSAGWLIACGCQDGTVSLWSSSSPHPVFLLSDLFEQGIMDLQWADDQTIIACSYEGGIAAIKVDSELIGHGSVVLAEPKEDHHSQPLAPTTAILSGQPHAPARMVPSNRDGRKRVTPMLVTLSSPVLPHFGNPPAAGQQAIQIRLGERLGSTDRFRRIASRSCFHFDMAIPLSVQKPVRIEIAGDKVLCCSLDNLVYWKAHLRKPCVAAAASDSIIAVLMSDNHFTCLSFTGRRQTPLIHFDAPVSLLKCRDSDFLVILATGQFYWFRMAPNLHYRTGDIPPMIDQLDRVVMHDERVEIMQRWSFDGHLWYDCQKIADQPAVVIDKSVEGIKSHLLAPASDDLEALEEAIAFWRLLGDEKQAEALIDTYRVKAMSQGKSWRLVDL